MTADKYAETRADEPRVGDVLYFKHTIIAVTPELVTLQYADPSAKPNEWSRSLWPEVAAHILTEAQLRAALALPESGEAEQLSPEATRKCERCGKTEDGWKYHRCPICGEMTKEAPDLVAQLRARIAEQDERIQQHEDSTKERHRLLCKELGIDESSSSINTIHQAGRSYREAVESRAKIAELERERQAFRKCQECGVLAKLPALQEAKR